ncbi:hypothetical protein ACRQ5Q_10950 [Bradyrhizobium sp. PMVTL-01]|uniref:hypothetical protein n=1 Tax=Bradyrhizobium sp. PMVTL-01 TaxID=3434999 RepID=UPI003F6E4A02
MNAKKPTEENYSVQEARLRLEAALKGARIVGHKPMESLTQGKAKKQQKPKKKI